VGSVLSGIGDQRCNYYIWAQMLVFSSNQAFKLARDSLLKYRWK